MKKRRRPCCNDMLCRQGKAAACRPADSAVAPRRPGDQRRPGGRGLLLAGLFAAPAYKVYGKLMVDSSYDKPGFTTKLGLKDAPSLVHHAVLWMQTQAVRS